MLLSRLLCSCSERRLICTVVRRLLVTVALLLRSTGSRVCGLRELWLPGAEAQAQLLWHMSLVPQIRGIFPDQGWNPCTPALAGGFFTTEPPGKPKSVFPGGKVLGQRESGSPLLSRFHSVHSCSQVLPLFPLSQPHPLGDGRVCFDHSGLT